MNVSAEAFIHPQAIVDAGACIGARTRVWALAHVCQGAVVGEDGNLCDHTFLEKGVRLGDRVTVKCGVYLWEGLVAEDDVFIGPCVAFTNDLRPRSRQQPGKYAGTLLRQGCSLGANSTILPVIIGRFAMVGAGSVVTKEVPDFGLVLGNPAKLRGWVCRCGQKLNFCEAGVAACLCGQSYQQDAASHVKESTV